jgi:hypothetical protein
MGEPVPWGPGKGAVLRQRGVLREVAGSRSDLPLMARSKGLGSRFNPTLDGDSPQASGSYNGIAYCPESGVSVVLCPRCGVVCEGEDGLRTHLEVCQVDA